jgi:CheY-like chemotaxis protein
MSVAEGVAADPRPEFKVAVFGLAVKFQRILEIVLRHARHNQYRYTVASSRGPGNYDIALVDMTVKGGPVVANTLRRISDSRPVITVGRRTDPGRRDDLLQSTFTMQVLKALNLVVDHQLLKLLPSDFDARTSGRAAPATDRQITTRFSQVGGRFPNTAGHGRTDLPRRPRVLVIDDSPTVRRQLLEALVPMGLDVEVVSGGKEAISVLANRRYDLIFVDVVMPDIDGYKLTRLIKKDKIMRNVSVIMLTSRSSPFDLLRGALAGCNSYLVKPVSLASLRETVQRHTRHLAGSGEDLPQLRLA